MSFTDNHDRAQAFDETLNSAMSTIGYLTAADAPMFTPERLAEFEHSLNRLYLPNSPTDGVLEVEIAFHVDDPIAFIPYGDNGIRGISTRSGDLQDSEHEMVDTRRNRWITHTQVACDNDGTKYLGTYMLCQGRPKITAELSDIAMAHELIHIAQGNRPPGIEVTPLAEYAVPIQDDWLQHIAHMEAETAALEFAASQGTEYGTTTRVLVDKFHDLFDEQKLTLEDLCGVPSLAVMSFMREIKVLLPDKPVSPMTIEFLLQAGIIFDLGNNSPV